MKGNQRKKNKGLGKLRMFCCRCVSLLLERTKEEEGGEGGGREESIDGKKEEWSGLLLARNNRWGDVSSPSQ